MLDNVGTLWGVDPRSPPPLSKTSQGFLTHWKLFWSLGSVLKVSREVCTHRTDGTSSCIRLKKWYDVYVYLSFGFFSFLRGFSSVFNFTRFFIFNFMTGKNFRIFLFDCYSLCFYFYSSSYFFFLILLLSISPFLSYSLIKLPTCSLLLDKLYLSNIWFSSDNYFFSF